MSVLEVQRITVRADRLVLDVQLSVAARYTTASLAARLQAAHPQLWRHPCVNSRGSTFGATAARTSLPHVFEHLAIQRQVEGEDAPAAEHGAEEGRGANAAAGFFYRGTTRWLDEAAGMARVELSFADDLLALRAVCQAQADLDALLATEELHG